MQLEPVFPSSLFMHCLLRLGIKTHPSVGRGRGRYQIFFWTEERWGEGNVKHKWKVLLMNTACKCIIRKKMNLMTIKKTFAQAFRTGAGELLSWETEKKKRKWKAWHHMMQRGLSINNQVLESEPWCQRRKCMKMTKRKANSVKTYNTVTAFWHSKWRSLN